MKLLLPRNPENRKQQIPYPAMEISNLANAEELLLYVDEGSILLSRKEISTREAIQTITQLSCVVGNLMTQLVDASQEMAGQPEEREDPLDEFDEGTLEDQIGRAHV